MNKPVIYMSGKADRLFISNLNISVVTLSSYRVSWLNLASSTSTDIHQEDHLAERRKFVA